MTDITRFKRLPLTMLALATALIVAVMSCGVAMAAEPKQVDAVTSIDVKNTSMKDGEIQDVTVYWEAPQNTHQGDSFTLGLPEVLSTTSKTHFPLTSPDGQNIADCVPDTKSVTCTFTDYVDKYRDVKGSMTLHLMGVYNPNAPKGEWTINGKSGIPGNPPVPDVGPSDPSTPPSPDYFEKSGWQEQQGGNDTVAWEVIIGSDKFLAGDPSGENLITLHDEPDQRLALYPSNKEFQVHIRYASNAQWKQKLWQADLEAGVDYTLTVDSDTHSFDVTFNKNSPRVSEMVKWAQNDDLGIQMYYYTIPYAPTNNTAYENTVEGSAGDSRTIDYTWDSAHGEGSGVGASVRLTKRDASSHDPLKGAVFDLVVGWDGKGSVIQKGLTSDDKGVVEVDNVYKGDYSLVETQAPRGYGRADPVNFTISDDTFDDQATVDLTMDDPRISGAVTWRKIDSATSQRLAGSQWTLAGSGGAVEKIVDDGQNDLDTTPGVLKVGDLAWGEYTLTETKAPAGYQLSDKRIDFTVDASHTTVTLPAIANAKTPSVPAVPVVPATPSVPATPLTPATPSIPVTPIAPAKPVQPASPAAPAEQATPPADADTRKLATTGSTVMPIAFITLILMLAATGTITYKRLRMNR